MRRKLGFGANGDKLKGPILYVPKQGAIFYESSLIGDIDGCAIVPIGVDYFESTGIFLEQLGRQVRGEKLESPYNTEEFDLSRDVIDVDISEAEFQNIASEARTAYDALEKFRNQSFNLISRLEEKLGSDKFIL